MLVKKAAGSDWAPTDYLSAPRPSRHRGGMVLAGTVSIGGVEIDPGEGHDVRALTDAVILVFSQKAAPVVERAGAGK